jgi:hypothetical protein
MVEKPHLLVLLVAPICATDWGLKSGSSSFKISVFILLRRKNSADYIKPCLTIKKCLESQSTMIYNNIPTGAIQTGRSSDNIFHMIIFSA